MSNQDRIFKAYLDDQRQSLQAPLGSVFAFTESLLELSVISELESLKADVEKIANASSSMMEMLASISALTPSSQTELSRLRHDLRNAIGLVDGFSEILLEDCDDKIASEYIGQIRHQSQLFQARLEQFTLGNDGAVAADPIEAIFKSFKRGILRDDREHMAASILVVDDNDSSRDLLAHQLQRQNYMVIEAASGERCLEIMRSAEPDVVLLDLVMPDMNGYEVLQVIRGDEALRRIPVVVISGMQDEEGAVRCIDAGASDYLLKPVNGTLLRARISASLETKQWRDREREYLAELEKSQRFIRKIFGRYLSDEIVQRLLDDNDGLKLGGELRQVTVLMADIRGFSALSQQLGPEQCVTLLNNYFGKMTEVIQRFRGTVDEFVGDGILVIFGAPLSDKDDCDRALACAVAMQLAIKDVNALNVADGLPEISMGIGLNTGDVVAGNVGSELRSKYGVVGHNVNLTGRIESCTVGGQILASPATMAGASVEVLAGEQVSVSLKGMGDAVQLSEVLGVGMPYDLLLNPSSVQWQGCSNKLCLQLTLMAGKQAGASQYTVTLDARAGDKLRVISSEALPVLADVRIDGFEACYAKITTQNTEREYVVTMTSTSPELQGVLQRAFSE
ncbi:Adenylate cyclase 2 [Zhongshania aliphaticivorans]|uniref:Adenylate cyclase 2 n=1 Tax=Zhongshania aliphaticivorans TaxID=1470434 RepID=A0A5S9NWR2_9GAMM|nr:adenylate/guanylate cyclase domain-containing protein [Zhongshania aliphaticivorans]CAA0095233.1 Adenylate cyclase 2 [Zhongshania aliphaticivorans]CAA0113030.1 Adenylate cyclase 2 [Zhongshania aliphaticivorans]